MENIINDDFYCLVAPDGELQVTTLAPDFPMCVAMIKMLHKAKVSKSFHELCIIGKYKILPVKVTIIQNGNENKPLNKIYQS